MAKGTGAVIGSVVGGVAGSVIPGVGTAIGSAAGQIAGNAIDQGIANRKREAATPLLEDPEQRRLLEEIRAKRRAMEMGMDVTTQAGINEVSQGAEATRNAVSRVTGGNAGQTIDALLRTQKMENQGSNQVLAQSMTRLPYFQSLEDQMQDRISQRVLDLQMFDRAEQAAHAAQYRKENVMNIAAGVQSGRLTGEWGGAGTEVQSQNPDIISRGREIVNNLISSRRNTSAGVADDSGLEPYGTFDAQ